MSSSFAGEPYLTFPLPDYASERFWILVHCTLTGVIFFFLIPLLLASPASSEAPAIKDQTKKGNLDRNKETQKPPSSSFITETLLTLVGLFVMFLLVLKSSNNQFTARSVWEAPLLTDDECQLLIDMAHRAAAANAASAEAEQTLKPLNEDTNETTSIPLLLRPPVGWQKGRHNQYPTTDLNLVTDPFSKEDQAKLELLLNRRLGPIMERIYGVNQKAIRANDMFIVRYDGQQGQPYLRRHTDSSHISFNVLLNTDFEGGGTRFHHRLEETHKDVFPSSRGNVILNSAIIEHEGLPTTNGTRYIFVGFTSLDSFDPFTHESNDLSWFASWLSFNWLQVRCGDGVEALSLQESSRKVKWADNKFVKSLFRDVHEQFTKWGDWWSPHRVVSLVAPANRTLYLEALDRAAAVEEEESRRQASADKEKPAATRRTKANWFQGQQVLLDVDGNIANLWKTRIDQTARFEEL